MLKSISTPIRDPADPPVRPSELNPLRFVALIAALLCCFATAALFLTKWPLGLPGKFVYLYSPLVHRHVRWALPAFAIALGAAWQLRRIAGNRARSARGGLILAVTIGLYFLWAYVAPPEHWSQHVFNLHSPSHDGAFVWETERIRSVRAYCRDFPRYVASPEARGSGTRILSNPPGFTLLAYAVRQGEIAAPAFTAAILPKMPPDATSIMGVSLLFSYVLMLLWASSVGIWHIALRSELTCAGAWVGAICIVISPMSLLFAPGKDCAQLLTTSLIVAAWLACRRAGARSWVEIGWSVAAGLALGLGLLASLVHAWILLILIVTDACSARSSGDARRLLLRICGVNFGLIAFAVFAKIAFELDYLTMLPAVARGQASVTRGPGAMPFQWQLLGIPLFLVYCGPALYVAWSSLARAAAISGDASAAWGRRLVVVATLTMFATVSFTNVETPRLWIPFGALILLGAALALPEFRSSNRAATIGLSWLLGLQLATAAFQWCFMDMREAENRLLGDEYWGAPPASTPIPPPPVDSRE